jgi:hypothetical protein
MVFKKKDQEVAQKVAQVAPQLAVNQAAPRKPGPIVSLPGFVTLDRAGSVGYALSAYGKEFSGKSRLILSMPTPAAIICMDMKTQVLMEKELESGYVQDPSQFLITGNLSRQGVLSSTVMYATSSEDLDNPELKASMVAYRNHVDKVKTMILAAATHPIIRSLAIDSGTVFFEDVQFANYGRTTNIVPRDRMKANREFMDILQLVTASKTADGRPKHLMLTARSKAVWLDNQPTSATTAEGCTKLGYFVQNEVELVSLEQMTAVERAGTMVKLSVNTRHTDRPINAKDMDLNYYLNFRRCVRRPILCAGGGFAALRDGEIIYPNIYGLIYPDRDPSEWE